MAGTKAGAAKAVKRILEIYGKDFYKNIGKKGGERCGIEKGFALMKPEKRSECGRKGGTKSKRGKAKIHDNRSYEPGLC